MRRAALPALALLAAGFAATLWLDPWADQRVNDLFVYRSFAEPVLDGALPYRDVFFEYPPLAAPAILIPGLAGTGEEAYRLAFAGWAFALAGGVVLLTGALAAFTGGDRRRAMLAIAAVPLLCGALVRTHFDLAPVALTLASLLLLVRDRPRAGLALLGAGAMTKGFPLVAAPVALFWLVARGERRAAVEGAGAMLLVVVALAGLALALSPDGAVDAVRYHLERPVQVESVPAVALNALDGVGLGEATSVASHRADGLEHPASGIVTAIGIAAMLAAVALLAAAAYRRPDPRTLVLAALAAVTAFAVLGKVLSPQFLLWIAPLGALAFAWRMHALAAAVAAAMLLTFAEFPSRYFDLVAREPFPLVLVTARDAVLIGALALAAAAVSRPEAAAGRSRWPGRRPRPRPAPR
jgi:hypothetical protein